MTTDVALSISHACTPVNVIILLVVVVVVVPLSGDASRALPTQMSPYVVETQYGRLRGVLVALPGSVAAAAAGRAQSRSKTVIVEAFFGLQYASLLGGELRFMPPTSSMEKWDGVRVALNFRPVCPQRVPDVNRLQRDVPTERVDHVKRLLPFLDKQNEECLNLNIYLPSRGQSPTPTLAAAAAAAGTLHTHALSAHDASVSAAHITACASPVLSTTGLDYGKRRFRPPTESTSVTRSSTNLSLVITPATSTAVQDLVHIHP